MVSNNKDEWFSTWFDSPLYHILYKNRNEEEAHQFLDLLIDQLNVPNGASILDLGCGRGRFAKYLGSKGFDVLGVDLSKNSIAYAKNFEHSQLHFKVHDMREPFKGRKFDYVLNLFTSFGYFSTADEELAVLKSVRNCLSKNGVLLIDFINGEKAKQNLIKENRITIDNVNFHISRWIENETIYKRIKVNGQQFREEVKLLSLEDFKRYADKTGFKVTQVFGNYKLKPFNKLDSDRLILVLKAD